MLRDTGALTLETAVNSELRKQGLLYVQMYNSVKECLAAGDHYPFLNPAIESLALDPQLRKIWQHVGAGLSHDPVALIKAYLHTKARCDTALRGSVEKSFGTRQEFRVTKEVFDVVDTQFRSRGWQDRYVSSTAAHLPYYTLPTAAVLSWYRWNINKFCARFEMVSSLSQRH